MIEVWVCNVRGRAYGNPKDPLEYICYSAAGGRVFMLQAHKEANCGRYVRTSDK